MDKSLPEKCREIIKKNVLKMKLDVNNLYPYDGITFYFIMSQNCNGNCPYCYQPKSFRKNINISKKIIDDSMEYILNNFDESKVKFCLFGGEPTLNWDMVKYVVESYPMFMFHMITNGIELCNDQSKIEWIKNQSFHFDITASIEPLRRYFGDDDFINKISNVLDLTKTYKGEVYQIVTDPDDEWTYDTYTKLIDYGVPRVRIAIVRQNDHVLTKREKFVTLFKRLADYTYFREEPIFNRSGIDICFSSNIFRKTIGLSMRNIPPTMCGCGYAYLAIDHKGDIWPCDWFINFPEFKLGNIYEGINDNTRFFYEANQWLDGLYEDCKNCPISSDIRFCPRAMCLAENYQESGNPLKPTKTHCEVNRIEYEVYEYIAKEMVRRGYVEKYNLKELFGK